MKISGVQEIVGGTIGVLCRRGFLVQLAMNVFVGVNLLGLMNLRKMDRLPMDHFS